MHIKYEPIKNNTLLFNVLVYFFLKVHLIILLENKQGMRKNKYIFKIFYPKKNFYWEHI